MSFGWRNPLPFQVGGDPSSTELVYAALRSARGQGGSGPEGGVRDLWDRARATAIAKGSEAVERAVLQAFPRTMTAHLPVWERILGVPEEETLPARQRAIELAMTAQIDATYPGLRDSLQKIDPAFTIEWVPPEEAMTTMAGRIFQQLPGTVGLLPFFPDGRKSTAWPNYSDGFVVRVRYVQVPGVQPSDDVMSKARELLQNQLPAWVDFDLYLLSAGPEGDGFYLDGGPDDDSLLGVTAF
jgi:hypothetical protein